MASGQDLLRYITARAIEYWETPKAERKKKEGTLRTMVVPMVWNDAAHRQHVDEKMEKTVERTAPLTKSVKTARGFRPHRLPIDGNRLYWSPK